MLLGGLQQRLVLETNMFGPRRPQLVEVDGVTVAIAVEEHGIPAYGALAGPGFGVEVWMLIRSRDPKRSDRSSRSAPVAHAPPPAIARVVMIVCVAHPLPHSRKCRRILRKRSKRATTQPLNRGSRTGIRASASRHARVAIGNFDEGLCVFDVSDIFTAHEVSG